MKDFFDDELNEDIDWESAPVQSPEGQDRLIGTVDGTLAIIELIGPEAGLTEIQLMVVMDGTSEFANRNRVLPLIYGAQKYGGDGAGQFVVDELLGIAEQEAVPAIEKTQRFGDRDVRFLGFDVINAVNVTITPAR